MDQADIQQKISQFQLTRAELENERLAIEIGRLRSPPWFQLPLQFVPLVTALVSVAGFLWGVVLYTETQKKNREEQTAQSLREQRVSEHEMMKPWRESQREIYEDALSAAATLANASDEKTRADAELAFWELFHGRMVLVETTPVADGMKAIGRCLSRAETCDRDTQNARVNQLATAMALSMAATAQMSYEDFAANQFKYRSPAAAAGLVVN